MEAGGTTKGSAVAERFDLVVRSRRAVTPEGERPASVAVRGGVIAAVSPYDAQLDAAKTIDCGEDALLPGLVDSHVHINEPGRTEWEGFLSATRAAAAGGITTLIDMPLNCVPPTTTDAALQTKRQRPRAGATSTSDSGAGWCPRTSASWRHGTPRACSASSAT